MAICSGENVPRCLDHKLHKVITTLVALDDILPARRIARTSLASDLVSMDIKDALTELLFTEKLVTTSRRSRGVICLKERRHDPRKVLPSMSCPYPSSYPAPRPGERLADRERVVGDRGWRNSDVPTSDKVSRISISLLTSATPYENVPARGSAMSPSADKIISATDRILRIYYWS